MQFTVRQVIDFICFYQKYEFSSCSSSSIVVLVVVVVVVAVVGEKVAAVAVAAAAGAGAAVRGNALLVAFSCVLACEGCGSHTDPGPDGLPARFEIVRKTARPALGESRSGEGSSL